MGIFLGLIYVGSENSSQNGGRLVTYHWYVKQRISTASTNIASVDLEY